MLLGQSLPYRPFLFCCAFLFTVGIALGSCATDGNDTSPDPNVVEHCDFGFVCGSGTPIECRTPIEFAHSPSDVGCTPIAFCPVGSVCGRGMAFECDGATHFVKDPTDVHCTAISECPEQALCELDGQQRCSPTCVQAAYRITEETSPTVDNPWKPEEDEALVALGRQDANFISSLLSYPALSAPHPARLSAPGEPLPDAKFTTKTVPIDGTNSGRSASYWYSNPGAPRWVSTGLYAAPGVLFTVEVLDSLEGEGDSGLELQVGSHADTDNIWAFPYGQPIRRFPEIIHRWSIKYDQVIKAAVSPFGGLIYIQVIPGLDLGSLQMKFTNVIEAPYYVHGQTTLAQWQDEIRDNPAPMAELVGDKVVLTVPSSRVRDLDPLPLMSFWDKAMDAAWYLAGIDGEGASTWSVILQMLRLKELLTPGTRLQWLKNGPVVCWI